MSGDNHPTHLVRPAHEVAAELQRRVARGRELLAQLNHSTLAVPERLQSFGASYWDWHDDNRAYLRRVFSTSDIPKSYADIAIEQTGDPAGYAELLRDLALGLGRDVSFLVGLSDRLNAYVPAQHP